MKLGERLIAKGLITKRQLDSALAEQRKTNELLGKLLQRLGYVSEDKILAELAEQANIEKVDISSYTISPKAIRLLPEGLARSCGAIPLCIKDGRLVVAMSNPFDIMAIQEMEQALGMYIDVKMADKKEILEAIRRFYGKAVAEEEMEEKKERVDVAPAVKLVDAVIKDAVEREATDIHIEPKENQVKVRFRIDGLLHEMRSFPKALQAAIATRIKIMANLNIAETRLPQDGRILFNIGNKKVDLRVSTFHTVFGEKIVLRVLDKEKMVLGLEELGLSSSNLEIFRDAIMRPYGIILVCGPTGSGKTTTLYSALFQINSKEKNIVTLEDPVEYEFPEITQSQIHLRAGLTFATGLRAILRQDPDVILVGEMRDVETVEVAIRAAITGHLVLSTLHTNDAVGAVARLLDMGVEPFLLASSLNCVVAQRLVRKICPYCKEKTEIDEHFLRILKANKKEIKDFYKGKGCKNCYFTGYKGRIGIFEVLPITPSLTSLIMNRADSQTLKESALKEGMKTLMQDGLEKAEAGITTLEEVVRVAYGI